MNRRTIVSAGLLGAILSASLPLTAIAQKEEAAADKPAISAPEITKLIAIINPVGNSHVKGSVLFEKTPEGIKITAKIGGLSANSVHAIHIHQFGDLASDDASSAGDHFNPGKHPHAMPDKEMRHAGDLGSLMADADGNATQILTVDDITLDAGVHGILGRAVIVHAKADDGGQPSGNAGDRIGAGVIGISKDAMKLETASTATGRAIRPTEPDSASTPPGE